MKDGLVRERVASSETDLGNEKHHHHCGMRYGEACIKLFRISKKRI